MSSESESDDDYVPEENPQKLSEEESADDETEKQYENEVEQSKKKRKLIEEAKGKKKRKTKSTRSNAAVTEEIDEPEEKTMEELDPEEQKKKEDDLWAMFLDGTDTKPKSKETPTTPTATVINKETTSTVPSNPIVNPEIKHKTEDAKEKEKRIFEFAGETIVVENDVIKERIKKCDTPATVSKLPLRASGASGVSGILGALNKKNKLSILEKSKLDWMTLKKQEGLEEEIKNHNKGKHGFLERQDFLERADLRQYELERELRMNRRSKR